MSNKHQQLYALNQYYICGQHDDEREHLNVRVYTSLQQAKQAASILHYQAERGTPLTWCKSDVFVNGIQAVADGLHYEICECELDQMP